MLHGLMEVLQLAVGLGPRREGGEQEQLMVEEPVPMAEDPVADVLVDGLPWAT